jgi:hypothetical protein
VSERRGGPAIPRTLARHRFRILVVLGLAVVLLFYAWTASGSPDTFPSKMTVNGEDYFNLQADAFREGQVSLLVKPSPQLLALPDPYDGAKSAFAFRLHDLSLYDRKYYLYWGPTPVLTLFMPARLLLKNNLSEEAAAVIFSFTGLLAALGLLALLARRHVPETPRWMLALAGLALATSSVLPYMLRRPTVYEVAIAAGFCFMMWGVLLILAGALRTRVSWWMLGLGSLALGLAAGARPSLAVAGVLPVVVLVALARRPDLRERRTRVKAAALLLGPVGVCGVLLLVYNQVRFDSFTEFGLAYQLNDIKPYGRGGLLSYAVPSAYFYLLAPARLNLDFPFFHVPPPPDFPGTIPDTYNMEPVQGLLSNVPIVLALLAGLPLALRAKERARGLFFPLVLLTVLGGLLMLSSIVLLFGATLRYAVDFTSLFLIAGLLSWFLLHRLTGRRWLRRTVAVGGTVLIAWGAVVGIAISLTGYTDGLRAADPSTYRNLEDAFSPLPTAATMLAGHPIITEALDPAGPVDAKIPYGTAGSGKDVGFLVTDAPATVEITSPDSRATVLRSTAAAQRLPGGPPPPRRLSLVYGPEGAPPATALVGGGQLDLPLRVHRGINRVHLSSGAPGVGVALSGVRLADR